MTYSWCELEEQLLEDLSSGSMGGMQSYSVSTSGGTRTVSYRSVSELEKLLSMVQMRCRMERGMPAYAGRTAAGTGF